MTSNDGIETGDLLDHLAGAGHPIRRSQLNRWQRAGIVYEPRLQSLGRGRGRRSEYPVESIDILLALMETGGARRSIRKQAWRAWWSGGPMGERFVRNTLVDIAEDFAHILRALAKILRAEELGDDADMEWLRRSSAAERLPSGLARVHQRVGRRGYTTVVPIMSRLIAGRLSPADF